MQKKVVKCRVLCYTNTNNNERGNEMKIHITDIDGTAIREMVWDRSFACPEDFMSDEGILTVTFARGTVYRYEEVPLAAVARIVSAESIGSEFVSRIRNCYAYERVVTA